MSKNENNVNNIKNVIMLRSAGPKEFRTVESNVKNAKQMKTKCNKIQTNAKQM